MRFALLLLSMMVISPAARAVSPPPPALSVYSDQPEPLKLKTQDACPLEYRLLEISLSMSQFNAGRTFDQNGQNLARGYRRDTLLWANVERGMGFGIELGVGAGYATLLDQDFDINSDGIPNPTYGQNFTDVKANGLWRFWGTKENERNLAYFIEAVFPTGLTNNTNFLEPGQGYLSILQKLAFTGNFDDLALNADLGCDLPSGNAGTDNLGQAVADLAFGWQLAQQFQPCLELSYEHGFFRTAPETDILTATLEGIVLWQPDIKTLLGVEQTITGRNSDLGTTFYLKMVILAGS